MRPRLSKKQLTSSPATPRSYTPVPGPKPPGRSTKIKVPPLVFVAHQKTLVQKHYLPPLKGHGAFVDVRPPEDQADVQATPSRNLTDEMGFNNNPFLDNADERTDAPPLSRHRRKREKQWERWQTEVIPHLIAPYMTLMCETESLRRPVPHVEAIQCTCGEPGRQLEIIVVRFACKYQFFLFRYLI